MRTASLLLLVALTTLAEAQRGNDTKRAKRDLLVRSKRRWVLSTMEVQEEDPGPFPKDVSQMFNDKKDASDHIYRISGMGVDKDPINVFSINENTGMVKVHQTIDREKHHLFEIKFDVLSKETGQRIDKELAFNIEIKDINDNAPKFAEPRMHYEVKENTKQGFLPVQLSVTDVDKLNTPNSEVTISILSQQPAEPKIGMTLINPKLAHLTFEGCFDYDKVKSYEVVVQAVDHGKPPQSSTTVVTLEILDTNTHPPKFKEGKYNATVPESTVMIDFLRVAVDDEDTPGSSAWRAVYEIIDGNEDKHYEIKTDNTTNEGILSIIKGKDFERTTISNLTIQVKNIDPISVCENNVLKFKDDLPPPDVIIVTIEVEDVNDPPYYPQTVIDVYQKEEQEPGRVLHIPEVKDVDSDLSGIRHVLLEDLADWVKIDEKTGKLTTTKKMDRESPFVDDNNVYKIVIGAIDNGKPPATGTCTVLVHLGDINDNAPKLINNTVIMCGNKHDKVPVRPVDTDKDPFGGPFAFFLGDDDDTLSQKWKLDPSFGDEGMLVSLNALPYGTYSVPLKIQDHQGSSTSDTLEVTVCNCGDGEVCLGKEPSSSSLGAAGIGLLLLGLLIFLLLLLFLFMCQCGPKEFKHTPMMEDEGNQTLIKYNQEAGGSECKAVPTRLLTPTNTVNVTDGLKMGSAQMYQTGQVMRQEMNTYNTSAFASMNSNMTAMGMERQDTFKSQRSQSMYNGWGNNRMNSYRHGSSSRFSRSLSLCSHQNVADHIVRRLYTVDGNDVDQPRYSPYEYAYEGQGSKCQSLDELSLGNRDDDLMFLDDLGPKFKTLAGICQQTLEDKNIAL